MAIDDNTIYGLYGSQIKDLPEKINAVKGLAKGLTTADYNWDSDNDSVNDAVALWLLTPGTYYIRTSGLNVYAATTIPVSSSGNNKQGSIIIVSGNSSSTTSKTAIMFDSNSGSATKYQITTSGSFTSSRTLTTTVRDNLTTTSTTDALSANQGKVLKDMIDAITGFSYEVVQTLPATGENGKIYLLPIDESGGPADNIYEEYIWVNNAWEMIGTTEMDLSNYVTTTDLATTLADYALASTVPSVVQSTGTSTTSVMSQNATTRMVYGNGSTARVQIGNSAFADGDNNIAIGSFASAHGNSYGNTSIGSYSNIEHASNKKGCIAVGAWSGSNASTSGTMDIGVNSSHTDFGYNNSQYRLLTGLYDPQSAHDAATKGYVDTEIAGISTPDTFTTNEWNALWA